MALSKSEIGKRLRSVREEVGISVDKIAAACGMSSEVYVQLESGKLDPVPGDSILIAARVLKTDFRYFISEVLDEVEAETRKVFRALKDPKPSDLLAIRRFMLFSLAESDLEALLEASRSSLPPTYPLPSSIKPLHKDQGKQAAGDERRRLNLGNMPVQNIFELIRSQGIRLSRHSLDDANLSGVTIAHPNAGVCILVNYEEDMYRQFFSAAHEYGHVLFDREAIEKHGCVVSYRYSKNELIEIRANSFAAEFLLPLSALARYSKPRKDDLLSLIERIARDYRVNTETVAIRMKEVGWIKDTTLQSFRKVKPVKIPSKDKRDPDLPLELTQSQSNRLEAASKEGISAYFLELLRKGLTEDAITFGRFAEMLDMSIDQAQQFISAAGLAI